MGKATQQRRHLAIGTPLGDDRLVIQSFTGSEQLGRLFLYSVHLLSDDGDVNFEELLGLNATVRLERPDGQTRYFNGFFSRIVQGPSRGRYAQYRAALVPWLWFLTRSADCRIFQDKSVPAIIKKVCADHGFTDIQEHLSGSYRVWPYCVQYRETAFNFISRLMEQEGIYYFFSHENGKHTLNLCDAPAAHSPIPDYEQVPFREPTAVGPREAIWEWRVEQELQSGRYTLRDFDFLNSTTDLSAKAITQLEGPGRSLEVFDYPGEYTKADEGSTFANIRLEELEAHGLVATGLTDSRGIAVGSLFKLVDHPRRDQNHEHLVTAMEYDFRNDPFDAAEPGESSASCRFAAIASERQFRPQRTTPKPMIQGPQTAIVVGPSGEEIYTDEHGRVKVMFHWDRESKADENSSCWIRVAQVWAGKQWGGLFTPRIGHEVIVEFLEGDPDRPIVTGRVYNGQAKPPYDLPGQATLSAIKSNSSKGGAGFNEIRFEDKKGEEQIFIHGEKNQDTRIKNDAFEWIGHDRHLVVKNDQIEKVENDRHETVTRDHCEEIGRDRNLKVKGKEAIQIVGSHSEKVTDDVIEVYQKNQSTQVTKDLYIKAENIVLEANTNITIKVGQSYIAIESGGIKIGTTGNIELVATGNIKTESTANTSIKGTAGVTIESPATAEMKSSMTTVKGDGMLTLKGGMVMIN